MKGANAIGSPNDKIEREILRPSLTSEFSHSLREGGFSFRTDYGAAHESVPGLEWPSEMSATWLL